MGQVNKSSMDPESLG